MDSAVLHPHEEGGNVFVYLPSGRRPYEEVLTFLRRGTELYKYGRHGSPKSHPFRLSNDDKHLQWESKKGVVRYIALSSIRKWERGQKTPNFARFPKPNAMDRSFSVFYQEGDKKDKIATLDVIAYTMSEFEMWFWGVQVITQYPPSLFVTGLYSVMESSPLSPMHGGHQQQAPQLPVQTPALDQGSHLRSSVGEDRPPKPTPKPAQKPTPKPKAGGLSVIVNPRLTGPTHHQLPLPNMRRDKREIGDLYVWGSLHTTEADDWTSRVPMISVHQEEMRMWQQSGVPVLAQNTQSMDVLKVACAPRHAALITRKGELYTWGYGKNGNLGHGWCTNMASPRLVTRMSGKGVRVVAVGEGATAAISSDMRLFIWGSNLAGQLGNGYTFPCAEPVPVLFPGLREDVRVMNVSCGPYHTAAIVEGGLLFTWGNGLFGKLGHGSHRSEYRPRKVEALEGKYVKSVSCGYWHTAAVVLLNGPLKPAFTPNGGAMTPLATPASVANPSVAQTPLQQPSPLVSSRGGAAGASGTPAAAGPSASNGMSQGGASMLSIVAGSGAVAGAGTSGTSAGGGSSTGGGGGNGVGGGASGAMPSGGLDSSISGNAAGRLRTSDMSSSGSDLQYAIAAANLAASMAAGCADASNPATASAGGGVTNGSSGSGPSASVAGDGASVAGETSNGGNATSGPVAGVSGSNPTGRMGPGQGQASGGGSGGPGLARGDLLNSSITSLDTLKDTMDESGASNAAAGVGALYTWGGDFSWMERLGEQGTPKRDHHGGCLGHGDKEGRTLPTRVRGDLDKHGVSQVACGWSMTVTLSSDGRVYQMGSTGAPKSAEKSCPWEGALVPTRVDGNLFGMYVEEVACGMHHVVVVASRVQANGVLPEDQRRVRLLTWGRGTEGQLGLDNSNAVASSGDGPIAQRAHQMDFNLPQVVAAVDGKRVLHISAGGNHTMAVLEHDPRSRRSHPAPVATGSMADSYDAGVLTPSGGGGTRGVPYGQPVVHSVVGAVTSGVRDVSNAASGLLSMSSPFLSQSLPISAGLQSLQQMVVGSSRSKQQQQQQAAAAAMAAAHGHVLGFGSGQVGVAGYGQGLTGMSSGGGSGMMSGASSAAAARSAPRTLNRRHQSTNKLVAFPTPTPASYGGPHASRGDAHRGDLRRSAARLHHFATIGHGMAPAAKQDGQSSVGLSAVTSAQSMEPAGSVSSGGGMASRRSSPPLPKGDEPYSRSVSPTSSSLYEMGSAAGDFAPSSNTNNATHGHPHGHAHDPHTTAHGVGPGAPPAAAAASGAAGMPPLATSAQPQLQQQPQQPHGHTAAGAAAAAAAAAEQAGSIMETLSHGGHSIADTAETEGDTDSYMMGQRIVERMPDHAHFHAHRTQHIPAPASAAAAGGSGPGVGAGGRAAQQSYLEGPEQSHSPQLSSPPPMLHPRVTMLGQPGPGGSAGDRVARSSQDTGDSSYATGGSGSEGLSPQGVPYGLADDASSTPPHHLHHQQPHAHPPQPQAAYAAHHLTSPSGTASAAAAAAAGAGPAAVLSQQAPSRQPSMLHPPPLLLPMEAIGRMQPPGSPAGAAAASGGSGSVTARPREISISTWAQPNVVAPAAAVTAAAAGGPGPCTSTNPQAAAVASAPPLFRSDVSFRTFGMHGSGDAGGPSGPAPTGPSGAAAGSRGSRSRGHSRNPSYDSAEASARDTDGSAAVGGGVSATGGFDLAPPSFVLSAAGGSGAHTPPRLTATPDAAATAANLALKQQNELLLQQIDALKQQVALLAQAAGLGAAASGAGSVHSYPPPLPPPMVTAQPVPASAALAATSAAMPPGGGSAFGDPAAAAGVSAVAHAAVATTAMAAVAPVSAPSPGQLQHAGSQAAPGAAGSPYVAVGPTYCHGLPPLGPGGAGQARAMGDRQVASAATTPTMPSPGPTPGLAAAGPPHPRPSAGRHRRSASVDVSSLIATRDGIGPAKDYLAPASSVASPPGHLGTASAAAGTAPLGSAHAHGLPQPHQHAPPGHLSLERVASSSRADGVTPMGHHTAPPALEALRHAHPGMSLAQAAVAEVENEGVDEDDEEEEEDYTEEEEDEEDGEEGGGTDRDSGLRASTRHPEIPAEEAMGQGQGGVPALRRDYSGRRQQLQPQTLQSGEAPIAASVSRRGSETTGTRFPGASDTSAPPSETSDVATADLQSYPTSQPYPHPHQQQQQQHLSEQQRRQQQQQQQQHHYLQMQQQQQQLQKHMQQQHMLQHAQQQQHQYSGQMGPMRSSGGAPGGGDGLEEQYSGSADPSGPGSAVSSGAQPTPTATVYQYAPGVYMHLLPPSTLMGKVQLCKVRFGRRQFSVNEAHVWWRNHKEELHEKYYVWPTLLGGAAVSRTAAPVAHPGSPSAGPVASPHGQQSAPLSHPGGVSQGTSGGGMSASGGGLNASGGGGSSNMYFSLGASPGLGVLAQAGSGGSATGYPGPSHVAGGSGGSGGAGGFSRSVMTHGVSAPPSGGGAASGGAGGGMPLMGGAPSDPYAAWADHVYDDPNSLLPPLPGSGPGGLPPRHNRSQSGSRHASGGAGGGVVPMNVVPMNVVPMNVMPSAVPAMSAASAAVAATAAAGPSTSPGVSVGSFQGGSAGSGSGSVSYGIPGSGPPAVHHRHSRSRSGGAASNLSSRSEPEPNGPGRPAA